MDVLTHAGVALVAASPFLASRPELALGIIAGSVSPDLDALCRLVGKRAFLRAHQSWSHALPVQLVLSIAAGTVAALFGWNGVELGGGLLAGLVFHSLLDLTNTFGVALFLPFSRRRFCLEWVFFIDAVILAAVVISVAVVLPRILRNEPVSLSYPVAFLAFLSAYVLGKSVLRRRAAVFCPRAFSLVPSALVPWRFFGTERSQATITVFQINALTGARVPMTEAPLLDDSFAGVLEALPEFRLMREVSPEYHVVGVSPEGGGTRVICRDMRVRNFGTRFGDLEVWLDAKRQIVRSRFYV
jgi:membrane-bound metal-dependent hydrolase YbcI (DUF457 family)